LKLSLRHKPEYFFIPGQLFRRLFRQMSSAEAGKLVEVKLPWGTALELNPSEGIGRAIWLAGVYEVAAMETMWRILSPGQTFLDIGANIGYVTSLLLRRVGSEGRGFCVEAHPLIVDRLEKNLALFNKSGISSKQVSVYPVALMEKAGEVTLYLPTGFKTNEGLATLVPGQRSIEGTLKVRGERLDTLLQSFSGEKIDLMKIDVEGAEYSVFKGAGTWIQKGRIRNILFELFESYPSPTFSYLEKHGYRVYRIEKNFWGPSLRPPSEPAAINWEPPSFLATQDPDRVEALLKPRGWRCLREGRATRP
jgi:FkbM family methyltransferase